ncbi:MAG: hypothetical protein FD139_3 [Methylocystaceae bacterium]|nr:MAG: hypothetical protein FD148_1068 [Methylocystaceae bacterium]KAF0205229.1 MAG: hypothetical protein FD172_4082 [Methylocystaceae bacterium]TXT48393.1 MAG: hypothetical protein FD139_3 [Methylocystaceae bacterium]
MLSVSRRGKQSSLGPREEVATVSPKQKQLLASYLLNLQKGEWFVFEMIVLDLQGLVDIGAQSLATDVFVVLRIFMRDRPQFGALVRRNRKFKGLSENHSTRRKLDSLFAANGERQTQTALHAQRDKQSLA